MQISNTSQKILLILFSEPNKDFFINEIIRKTGLYPNSVYKSLNTLLKQKILRSYTSGKRKFFRINADYKNLNEINKIVLGNASNQDKKDHVWVKILNRESSHSFTTALCHANIVQLDKRYGFSISTFWHNSITNGVYYLKNDLVLLGNKISDLIKSNPNFAQDDIKACYKTCKNLTSFSEKIPSKDLIKESKHHLAQILKNFYKIYLEVFPFVTVPHAIERFYEERIRTEIPDDEIVETLLAPTSSNDEERNSAIKIAIYVKNNGFSSKARKLLEAHWQNYCWMPLWSIHAKPLTYEYFENEIKNILERKEDLKNEQKRMRVEENKAKTKLQNTFRKINAPQSLINEVKHLHQYIYLRIYRKNAISKAHYYILPLIYEAASRLKISQEEIKLLSFDEISDALVGKISQQKVKELIKDRQKGWAILVKNGKLKTICGVKEIIEVMERHQIIAPTSAMQRVVRGTVACRGKVIGKARIVTSLSDINKVQKGDVLIAKMTTPDYMIAINKAVAIVTDEGGITCHAAIVSREFNIPCITSTKNATQILSDNDLVEVDAENGVVRIIESINAPENTSIFNGRTIYKGKVKGYVKIVLDAADFEKVEHNDILIAPQTTPEYLSCLYRTSGFVVDEDSPTSHAVLYGRALRLPSVMGTIFARHVLKDGDLIELDATKGLIRKLS